MHKVLLATVLLALATGSTSANLIFDFETTPTGATPIDNTVLSDPYTLMGISVLFYFDVNANNVFDLGVDELPVFEQAGNSDPVSGLVGSDGDDVADPGFEAQLGQFFLRQPPPDEFGVLIPGPFIIDYDTLLTISALSGEIWDIDGTTEGETEQWLVEVLDTTGSILANVTSPLGTLLSPAAPLDGQPWIFSFTGLPSGVDKVRLTYSGSKTDGIGLAFNNYSSITSTLVPEPSTLSMVFIAVLIIGYDWRRWAGKWRQEPFSGLTNRD